MKYQKPFVTLLAPAVGAIQSGEAVKSPQIVQDTNMASPFLSNGAYESDE